MRYTAKILIILLLINRIGIAQQDSLKFRVSTNYWDTKPSLVKNKTIKKKEAKLNIYFYKKHFALFYGLPKDLIKRRYRNKSYTKWALKREKNFQTNWTETFTYDSLGRLTVYRYSGCKICSSFPGGFKLVYNENDYVIKYQSFHIVSNKKANENWVRSDSLWFDDVYSTVTLTYDDKRNIIKLEEFERNSLSKLIEILEY